LLGTIQISSIVIALLAFLVIAFKHKRNIYQKTLLQVYVLSLTYYAGLVFLIKTGLILEYPHIRGTGPPVNYLHLVTFLLFIKSTSFDLKAPKKFDLILLFIPVVMLGLVSPFFFEDVAFKLDHIRHVVENEDAIFYTQLGYMPAYWNFMVQFGLGILFSAVAIYWLATGLKEKKEAKSEFTWLICVATLMFLGNLFAMIALIFDSSNLDLHSVNAYLFALYLIIIFLYLFFEPSVLYRSKKSEPKKSSIQQLKAEISSSELEDYRSQLDRFFEGNTSFLSPDFRQEDLANSLNLSKNHLSQLITIFYQKNFNQLVNEKRIEVALQKFETSDWSNFTLEGVSQEVGFKSRTTFIKAFKEKTGTTPSAYKRHNMG
jgi:AraC-like DNA-binding protein